MGNYLMVLMGLISMWSYLFGEEGCFFETKEGVFRASLLKPLEVFIDVDAGGISVQKGQSPEEGKATFKYDKENFKTRFHFSEERNRLRISIDKRNWKRWPFKGNKHDEFIAELKVLLPYDVDIYLDVRLKAGETTMQLGGLRLKEVNLNNWAGKVKIGFQEPNPIVMVFLDIHNKVGEMELLDLGNARFERADIDGGIGALRVDFHGDLMDKSRAKVDIDIGEVSVYLPSDVGTLLIVGGGLEFLSMKEIDPSLYRRGRYYLTEDYKDKQKQFSLYITPGLGELRVEQN